MNGHGTRLLVVLHGETVTGKELGLPELHIDDEDGHCRLRYRSTGDSS